MRWGSVLSFRLVLEHKLNCTLITHAKKVAARAQSELRVEMSDKVRLYVVGNCENRHIFLDKY